jgi:hypothetical protein
MKLFDHVAVVCDHTPEMLETPEWVKEMVREMAWETLIERLNARAHDPKRVIDESDGYQDSNGKPVVFVAASPATLEQVAEDEERLGFSLPALLRQVYLQVGDGGFGPGYGLFSLTASNDHSICRRLHDAAPDADGPALAHRLDSDLRVGLRDRLVS